MNLKKVCTKCGVQSSPLSLFGKFDVFRALSVIVLFSVYRKCMEELRFSKKATKYCYAVQI